MHHMKKFFIFGPKCSLFGFLCLSSWFRMYINSFAAVFNKFLRMARQKGKEPTEKKSLRAGSKKKPIPRKTAVFSSDDEEKEGGAIRIDDSQGEEEEEEQPHTSDREFLNDSEPEYADSSDPLEDILSDDSADFVQKKPSRSSKAGNKSVASKKKAVSPPPATSDDDSEDFVRKKSRLSKSASKPTRAKAPSSPRNEDDPARQAKTAKRQSLSKEQPRSKSLTASPRASSAPVEEEEESSDELEEEPLVGTKRPRKKSGGPIKKKKATERPRVHDASSILKDKLKSLGKFQLPVASLVAPRYQVPGEEDEATRDLDNLHVENLKESFKVHSGGLELRSPFLIWLAPHKVTASYQKLMNNLRSLVDKKNDKELHAQVYHLCTEKLIRPVTIGGNHSREALQQLMRLKNRSFPQDLTINCQVFINLELHEARAIGLLENKIGEVRKMVSFPEQIHQIRAVVRSPVFRKNPEGSDYSNKSLNDAGWMTIHKILSHPSQKETDEKKLKNTNGLSTRVALNIPPELESTFFQILDLKKPGGPGKPDEPLIKTSVARLFDWTLPVDRLGPLLDNLLETRDLTKFGTAVGTLKCSLKLEKAIDVYHSQSDVLQSHPTYKSKRSFFRLLREQNMMDPLLNSCSAELRAFKSTSKPFVSVELNNVLDRTVSQMLEFENELLSEASIEVDPESQPSQQSDTSTQNRFVAEKPVCSSVHYPQKEHRFYLGDCFEVVQQLVRTLSNPGMVFIDPPFGVLQHQWDERWSEDYWKRLVRLLVTNWRNTPVVVFMAYEMWLSVGRIFETSGYKNQMVNTWFKSNYVFLPTKGSPGHCCNLIVIFSVKPLVWNSQDVQDWPPTANGNLLVAPNDPKALSGGVVVNPTQKPLALLRALMWRHCPSGKAVVDLCSGSGSTACAAATLGSASFNVDNRRDQIDNAKSRLVVFCASTPSLSPVGVAFNFDALVRTDEGVVEAPKVKGKPLNHSRRSSASVPQPTLLCNEDEEEPDSFRLNSEDEAFLEQHQESDVADSIPFPVTLLPPEPALVPLDAEDSVIQPEPEFDPLDDFLNSRSDGKSDD